VKDIGPVVESYIGFIETCVCIPPTILYRLTLLKATWIRMAVAPNGKASARFHRRLRLGDGHQTGFVAIVDKEMSTKYETLVNDAPELIKDLPWGPDFEVDVFRKPDFTALQIVSFATGGIPAGINVCCSHSSRG
jgi:dipeptidyl-peptidase-3